MNEFDKLRQENEELKRRLNLMVFGGDDGELALRYLVKIGYVDFDKDKKQYVNTHADDIIWSETEREADPEDLLKLYVELQEENETLLSRIREYKNQQKEFIKFLEDNWKETQDIWYIKVLNKYKEIVGYKDE